MLLQNLHPWKLNNTEATVDSLTHGQALGRTKSRKFAQVEENSKINILFLIFITKQSSIDRI